MLRQLKTESPFQVPRPTGCVLLVKFAVIIFFFGSIAPGPTIAQDSSAVDNLRQQRKPTLKWGHLKGQILVTGNRPKINAESVGNHADRKACLVDGKIPDDDNIVIGAKGQLRDVYVMMVDPNNQRGRKRRADNTTGIPIHPSYDLPSDRPLSIDNVQCRFVPHALFVRTGRSVILKNSDAVGHNCHITTLKEEHNVNLPAGQQVEIKLEKSSRFPGQVVCDIHRWMDAVILVRDHPYVAITDQDGRFEIQHIPAGQWEFQFWHKKVGFLKKLTVEKFSVGRKGQIKTTIQPNQTLDLGRMTLSAEHFKK